MNRYKRSALALLVASVFATGPSWGNEQEEMEVVRQTTINLIQALVDKGVLTQDAANDLIKQAEKSARKKVATTQATESKVVRVPYVPESVKREIRDQVKQEVVAQAKAERWGDVNAVPEWVERLHWEGDLRVRYQSDRFAKTNAAATDFTAAGQTNVTNSTEQRDRARVRARLGLLAKVTPGVTAGFRLTTGNTSDPVSTNQTLGTYENKYTLVFDRAYLKLDPWEWLTASAGRIPNPYFSTDLVWDDDLNFEGLAATLQTPVSSNTPFRPFVTAGVFPLQEIEQTPTVLAKDKWFWGAQAGFEWRMNSETRFKLGAAYYDFKNVEGIPSAAGTTYYEKTEPLFRQKGNSVFDIDPTADVKWALASKYELLNLTGSLDLAHFDPVHVILTGDYVKNIGFNKSEILARTISENLEPKTKGWQARVAVGMPSIKLRHDWQAYIGYRRLDRDAVMDAFTDSDFHLGGTDAKGYFIGGVYGLDKNTWLSMRWLSADEVHPTSLPLAIDVMQVDLNVKF